MPILDMQKRLTEVGRIRLGRKGNNGAPQKLENFRLTSRDKAALEAAAALYGGTVGPWEGQAGQFELYTTVNILPILVAPQEVTQWYETWSAGGVQRRCDGHTCQVPRDGSMVEVACMCDPEKRECKATTRLSVFLRELPSIGVWRLESHGHYAAVELPSVVDMLSGRMVPAILAIEQRERVSHGKTKKFIVPVIRLDGTRLQDALSGPVGFGQSALPEPTPELPAPQVGQGTADPDKQEAAAILQRWGSTVDDIRDFKAWCVDRELVMSAAVLRADELGARDMQDAARLLVDDLEDDRDREDGGTL